MNDVALVADSTLPDLAPAIPFLDVEDLKTETVLSRILKETEGDKRFQFLVKNGMAGPLLTRLRVKLSRVRVRMQELNLRMQHFRLRSEVGRYDNEHQLITVWRFRSMTNEMTELYQDMLREGKVNNG